MKKNRIYIWRDLDVVWSSGGTFSNYLTFSKRKAIIGRKIRATLANPPGGWTMRLDRLRLESLCQYLLTPGYSARRDFNIIHNFDKILPSDHG